MSDTPAVELPSISKAIASGYGWQPVVGYEGIYEVSWCGCVRRIAGGRGTRVDVHQGRCIRSFPGAGKSKLYRRVQLSHKGVRKTIPVHIMVAEAWLGPRPEDEFGRYEVHHRDNDISNNCVFNLEYISKEENMKEAWHRYITKGDPSG